jgi:uncharacterized membrane protein
MPATKNTAIATRTTSHYHIHGASISGLYNSEAFSDRNAAAAAMNAQLGQLLATGWTLTNAFAGDNLTPAFTLATADQSSTLSVITGSATECEICA